MAVLQKSLPSGKPAPVVPVDWEAALAQHGRWLRTIVIARLGDAQGVDDVLQEISLAAVRQAAPLQDSTKVAPWLYRLAVTQCLLYRRTHGRRRKLTQRYAQRIPDDQDSHPDPEPLQWLLAVERQKLIRQGLEQLNTQDREILLLKYTEDWNYQQLAAHLGISHSAVETRLHRARSRLRQVLAKLQVVDTGD
ncbi:MAG: RNA polymerase sigma factor [Pirellulales bacterium]|nr:RNA polymerase sigma factor [Pirellulales bacterium]